MSKVWQLRVTQITHLKMDISACQCCHKAGQSVPTAKLQKSLAFQLRRDLDRRCQDALIQSIMVQQK